MGTDNSKNMLYVELGVAVVLLVATVFRPALTVAGMVFQPDLTVAGPVLIFGVVGLFGAMQKPRLLNIAKYYAYLAPFSVLVVMITTFFPFIGGKDYFFRFSVELALIFTVLWWAFEASPAEVENRAKVFKKPLFIAVSLFVLVYLLSTAFAYDPNAAFWSNYERGEGGFQMLHYYAFFALLVFLLDKKEDWLVLMRVLVVAATLMVLYGFLADAILVKGLVSAYGDSPPAGWWANLTRGRFQGSLGNPAYVAPYLLFSLFYLAYLWAASPRKTWLGDYGYGALGLLFLFFFILSQTRGAFIGLGTAVFVFFVYLCWSMREWRKWLLSTLIVLVIIVSGLIFYKNSDFVKKLPGSRVLDISLSDQTLNTRLWTWGSAWEGFKERPILGWGPENFSAVFDKYFDPRHYVPGQNTETWFDRAHSLYFDALAETGVLGFMTYFGIFALLFWKLAHSLGSGPSAHSLGSGPSVHSLGSGPSVHSLGSGPSAHSPIVEQKKDKSGTAYGAVVRRGLMIALPVGYLVQGLAIFDVLPIYINLFLFFALSVFYLNQNE